VQDARERHYRWEWELESTPEQVWPLVSDTNRFNRDAGVPALEERDAGRNARRRLRLTKLGLPIEWEEEPFEWVRPHRFSVVRRYSSGPVASMRVAAELHERPGGGTRLVYEVWARPRTVLGRLAIPIELGLLTPRRFGAVFRSFDRQAAAGIEAPVSSGGSARLAPGGRERLAAGHDALLADGVAPELAGRLAELIELGDELTLTRLRPYALARIWGAERRAVLELFLRGTRAGLLELRWDVLCPLCRGAQESPATLADVGADVHCATCNIDFTVNFDRFVELTFRPSAAIRELDTVEFCVAGPQVTPHVAVQQLLAEGAERSLTVSLEPGRYALRTLALPGSLPVRVEPDGGEEAEARAAESGWPGQELVLAGSARLRLRNDTTDEQLFILERTAWRDDAVTAAEVTALQVFRDLFSTEALRPGEPISVGTLTVVFTDLRSSTRFYREVGDAPAFGSVMDHLALLREAVAAEGGAVVKTIGDAIMAVFTRPVAAVRALLAAQRSVAGRPLSLKVGIHLGPCIAVTQNERLDYFGSTVNVAARLVDLSSGEDVVVSGAVAADPEVAELLETELSREPLEASLKGFDEERFELWVVRERVPAHA
jgi:class 3 adenylate cyclase